MCLDRRLPGFRFLFLMDPYDSLNLETETSLALMAELLVRGQAVYWLEESGLHLRHGIVWGEVARVTSVMPFVTDHRTTVHLDDFDALLVRKDPPFDQQYLHLFVHQVNRLQGADHHLEFRDFAVFVAGNGGSCSF